MNPVQQFQISANSSEAEILFEEFLQSYSNSLKINFNYQNLPDSNFLKIFGNSHFLARKLILYPEMVDIYLKDPFRHCEKPLTSFWLEITNSLRGISEKNHLISALKKFKYQEYLRLTIRELNLENQEEIYREFSNLSCVIVKKFVEFLIQETVEKFNLNANEVSDFAILAMGKLGGLELNYSSDIDLIALYENDGNLGSYTQHEFFVKVFSQLGSTLPSIDENGFLYRVDWDLRPEGKTGTLANSLTAMESYYETFGAEWERQAFIKAGILHQSGGLGEKFLRTLVPFTYRKYLDGKTIQSIHDMKSRILDELNRKKTEGFNIKLGKGGIRDIEFLVQGLQLLHGGKNPNLRGSNTLEALSRLVQHGWISPEKGELLRHGYLFLRRVESALQMNEEQQTHILKHVSSDRLQIARRVGFYQEPQHALDAFNEQIEKTVRIIHDLFEEFHA